MKRIVIVAIALFLLILENTILPSYSIMQGYPSILFVFAIAFSIINGKKDAMFIGIVSGVLQDLFFINGFGINLLVNFLLCLLAAKIGEGILKNNRLIPVISCFIISILKIIMIAILFIAFDKKVDFNMAIVSAVLNTIVMLIGYKFVLTTSKKFWKKDEWRFR
ncbi:rod shape-determining protein MreD [Clostridium sp. NSJ-49]|uniref:Rod shape-determining protein, subunit D n=1 Tax=Clostridium disporicum TaxID=84024 RepID=A0A174FHJ8_9CLOT|nr:MULTISPECIES: rod shape-determining protein MreD [Clostridium]MBC5624354.1 rod shape-determining protein MreD [Clostridium sp. NSJ-49]MCD2501551.1 rod shape-determining protein MreD [Clostridium sp. NSJ-145]CUO49007.1 rod shape-determining protein%2C subunit D [Clostridium disporicum]